MLSHHVRLPCTRPSDRVNGHRFSHLCKRVFFSSLFSGLHTNFFSWWPDRATKIINYQFLVARRKKKSEMNGGNIRLRIMLKIIVGCLSLASETNDGNIRLRMTLK